ncbi:Uncharacterised protein [Parabacteroides distasonis]|uniref:Uncharacterized protein n=1 Tax=Parabacteroides distasonis TaxID=823 RepID=A0A6N3HEQ9_PARDI|nr:hypothetical protein HMPREF1075_03924 [Parabacteroides distasonis CL03T12C09]CDB48476.1 unknown [Parabacteroides sp. CAG:2]DAW27374.1 MAG TPA: hypothetical protein [Caudoviricetes sp.]
MVKTGEADTFGLHTLTCLPSVITTNPLFCARVSTKSQSVQ